MIFVVVGTQKFALNRLLREVDVLIEKGIITQEVFAQTGHSDYTPRNYDYIDFMPKDRFDMCIKQSDLLITHCGVGTIISGLQHRKPIIVYPRLSHLHEHIDDHQLEIAKSFSELNYVLVCGEGDKLENVIEKSKKHQFNIYNSQQEHMLDVIEGYLEGIYRK